MPVSSRDSDSLPVEKSLHRPEATSAVGERAAEEDPDDMEVPSRHGYFYDNFGKFAQ